jgi:hypothetical protein
VECRAALIFEVDQYVETESANGRPGGRPLHLGDL